MEKSSATEFQQKIPKSLRNLASVCHDSLYIIGGSVRDFLAGNLREAADWDICAPFGAENIKPLAARCGLTVRAVYANTGTMKLEDGEGNCFEFSRFRSDRYVRGKHTPEEIFFTEDIGLDARRRDFCANAVYFDIAKGEFLDPLGGIGDIERGILRTVAPAEKVFGEDGLRLVRLARIAAQTGFSPDEACVEGARRNCALVRDIAPERIFCELELLLFSDSRAKSAEAPYRGLCILRGTGVLKELLPELAAGDGMAQRKDFHDHDVLEHSLRCVRYAPPSVRWAALLHDVGKPYCFLRDGNFYAHAEEGARIAREILTRLKAPKALTEETVRLVKLHMRDLDCKMRTKKVRLEIAKNIDVLEKLFALKQADYSACKDDLSPAPGVEKWKAVLAAMRAEGCPLTLRELNVKGGDLLAAGVPPEKIGEALETLLSACVLDGGKNSAPRLLEMAKKFIPDPQ